MSDFDVKEKRFEEDIEDYLIHHGGYTKGDQKKFNRESGLDEDTFVEFFECDAAWIYGQRNQVLSDFLEAGDFFE